MKMPAAIEKWGPGVLGVMSLLLLANLANQFRHAHPLIALPAPENAGPSRAVKAGGLSHAADDLSQYDPMVNLDSLKKLDTRPLPDIPRSLFSFVEPPAPAPPAAVTSPLLAQTEALAAPAIPPPPPPPIQMKIMGYNEMAGRQKCAFASYQNQEEVVQEGDVVGSRYKILKITPLTVLVEDATSHQTTQLPIPQ